MFGDAEVLNLIAALRDWEREGQILPEAVAMKVRAMEETLRQFAIDMAECEECGLDGGYHSSDCAVCQ